MAKTSTFYMRIDPEIKAAVEEIYSRYGITLTEAFNMFLRKSIMVGGLPFDLRPSPTAAETEDGAGLCGPAAREEIAGNIAEIADDDAAAGFKLVSRTTQKRGGKEIVRTVHEIPILASLQQPEAESEAPQEAQVQPVVEAAPGKKPGRNKPCPCGSGKKYKHCHGR